MYIQLYTVSQSVSPSVRPSVRPSLSQSVSQPVTRLIHDVSAPNFLPLLPYLPSPSLSPPPPLSLSLSPPLSLSLSLSAFLPPPLTGPSFFHSFICFDHYLDLLLGPISNRRPHL